MISPFRFTLNPAWLPALAGLTLHPAGVLSPWHGQETPPLPDEARQALQEEGLLDPAGAVSPGFSTILNLLASPAVSLHLHLDNSEKQLDYRLYFSGLEDESASLLQSADGLALTAPARPNDILSALRQHTGESLLQPVSFSADLPLNEAMALAALLDRRRQARLFSLAAQAEMETTTLSPALAAERAITLSDPAAWLTAILRSAAGVEIPPDASHFAAALQSLVQRGLAVPLEDGYLLGESPASLADRLLLLENRLHLTVRRANPDGDINQVEFLYLQSNINTLLRLELLPGLVRFETVPAATLLDQVEYFLTHPTALPMPPARPAIWKLGLVGAGGLAVEYELASTAKIGRGSDCEVQINDPRSSRHHAIIHQVEDGYEINDLGSTNGTYLNHIQLTGPQRLQDGDLIRIGETYLKVISSRSTAATAPTPRRREEEPPLPALVPEPALNSEPSLQALEPIPAAEPPIEEQEPAGELPDAEPEPAASLPPDLPAWLRTPPGETLQLPDEPGEEELPAPIQEEPELPAADPLAWLYTARQAQEQAAPPAEGDLLAPPPADLEELQPEPATEDLPAEDPILGETRPVLAAEEPPEEPEEPITGETRKVASGRSRTQQICPHCGASSPLNARFCGTCGNQLQD